MRKSYESKYGPAVQEDIPLHAILQAGSYLASGLPRLVPAALATTMANAAMRGPFATWLRSGHSTPMDYAQDPHIGVHGPNAAQYLRANPHLFQKYPYLRQQHKNTWKTIFSEPRFSPRYLKQYYSRKMRKTFPKVNRSWQKSMKTVRRKKAMKRFGRKTKKNKKFRRFRRG